MPHLSFDQTAAARLERLNRRERVLSMICSPNPPTQIEIARKLGVCKETIHRDIAHLRAALNEKILAELEQWKSIELDKLQRMDVAVESKACGEVEGVEFDELIKAQQELRKNMERRAKLLGLDAPTSILLSSDAVTNCKLWAEIMAAEGVDLDRIKRILDVFTAAIGQLVT